MPPTHIFFIPTVFLFGFLLGIFVSQWRRSPQRADADLAGVDSVAGDRGARASWKMLLFAFVVVLGVFVLTHASPMSGGVKDLGHMTHGIPMLDKFPAFSAQEVHARLEAYGEQGRHMYQRFTYTTDLIFPLSLLLFLLTLSHFVRARTRPPAGLGRALHVVPVLWFLSDMVENGVIYRLISAFPADDGDVGSMLGWLTMGKFALLASSVILPALSAGLYTVSGKGARLF